MKGKRKGQKGIIFRRRKNNEGQRKNKEIKKSFRKGKRGKQKRKKKDEE